jgi:hypothetical protein
MDSTQKERSSLLSRYFSEIRAYPLLTKEQEQTLAKNVQNGCQHSLHELIATVRGPAQRGQCRADRGGTPLRRQQGHEIHHLRHLVDSQVDPQIPQRALQPGPRAQLPDEKGA